VIVLLLAYKFNKYNSFEPIEQFIISIVFLIIGFVLLYNINILRNENTVEYENRLTTLVTHLDNILLNFESFSKLEKSPFLKHFIERWTSLQNTRTISTYAKKITAIDNEFLVEGRNGFTTQAVEKLVGLLRPSTNLFLENNEFKTDLGYLYDEFRSNKEQNPPLPELSEYNTYNTIATVEIIAWVLLVVIYYNIFHIYCHDTDMFVEIIIALIILLILLMMVYYIVVARDSL
jgi:hypothetical protein